MTTYPERALVLAAGVGRRLQPQTNTTHKGLLDIEGRALLRHQLEALYLHQIRDISIVVGYRQSQLRAAIESWDIGFERISWIENPAFATTNTLTSVHLAASLFKGQPFILCNGDVWLAPHALNVLKRHECGAFLLVDDSVALDEEAMKVNFNDNQHIVSINKTMPIDEALGESIGIYGFDAASSTLFFEHIQKLMDEQKHHMFYEAALAQALQSGLCMSPLFMTPETWAEVDDITDLNRARQYAKFDQQQ